MLSITSEELERLQTTRTQLENEHRSLEEEQKNLELRTRILEEKIAIGELKRNNKTRNEAITQLKDKIGELEQKLTSVGEEVRVEVRTEPATPPEPTVMSASEEGVQAATFESVPEAEEQEPEEETLEVHAVDDFATPEQQEQDMYKRQHEKKRRRLF